MSPEQEWVVWEERKARETVQYVRAWTKKGALRKWRKLCKARGALSALPKLTVMEEWHLYAAIATWPGWFIARLVAKNLPLAPGGRE